METGNKFGTSVYLFESDPPYFNESLGSITASSCNDIQYTLPSVIDPNNYTVTIRLDDETPIWIQIQDNSLLSILSKTYMNSLDSQTEVTIILENELKAWRKYSLNITIEHLSMPVLSQIQNIKTDQLEGDGVFINLQTQSQVNVVNCLTDDEISWLAYEDSRLKLRVSSMNTNTIKKTCWRFSYIDPWKNTVFSNQFYIGSDVDNMPPVLLNPIGPFQITVNSHTLFLVPDDMFIDFDGDKLIYTINVVSCNIKSDFKAGIISNMNNNRGKFIYAHSSVANNWKVWLVATDLINQSSEQIIDFKVYNCASKNWAKWEGFYQIQCNEWLSSYEISESGACLRKVQYFLFHNLDFFLVMGITVLTFTIIHVLLSIFFGRRFMNSIWNIQTIIVFVYINPNLDKNLKNFFSNILFIKFDFGFLHNLTFENKHIGCKIEIDKLADLQFYCQSTVQNYFFLVLLSSMFLFWWVWLIELYKFEKFKAFFESLKLDTSKIICTLQTNINNPKHVVKWCWVHLLSQFVLISVTYDILNMYDHMICSFVTYIGLIWLLVYLWYTRFEILSLKFIKEMEPEYEQIDKNASLKV